MSLSPLLTARRRNDRNRRRQRACLSASQRPSQSHAHRPDGKSC